MAVLYRKYRPQVFSEVLGQKYIIQTLKNQVKSGKVAHAYLFTGGRGVGKTSVARVLAKAVNCEERIKNQEAGSKKELDDACGKCNVCTAIAQGNFIDLVEIDAASNTGVDNIRELIEHVKFSPSVSKFKVFIIDEVHMLSKGAFNALLKTLEEPPKHAIFVLATTEAGKVPATIVSRTQRFDFKRLDEGDLKKQVEQILESEKVKLSGEVVGLIAQNAEGSSRDALSLLDKVLTLGEKVSISDAQHLLGITDTAMCDELLGLIAGKNIEGIPGFFDRLSDQGTDFAVFNRDFLEFLRKVLVAKITGETDFTARDESLKQKLKQHAGSLEFNGLIFIIRLFLKSYKDLNFAPSPQLPLLVASLEAVYRSGSAGLPPSSFFKDQSSKIASSVPSVHISQNQAENFADAQAAEISLKEVKGFWLKFINEIKAVNGPLANLVKNSSITGTEKGAIKLSVKFLFNKQNLENPKSQELLSELLQKVSGKELSLRAEVEKGENHAASEPAQALSDALKIFGGELVD